MTDNLYNECLNPQLNQKKMKKLAKKVQKDPKMQDIIHKLRQNLNVGKKNTTDTPRDRIHNKIKQLKLQRGGKIIQQYENEKKKPTNDTTDKVPVDLQTNVKDKVDQVMTEVKQEKKRKHDKLKRLQKKYGQITVQRWTDALKIIYDFENGLNDKLSASDYCHERNIVDLYNKQNATQLELNDNILDTENIDDLSDLETTDMD